MSEKYNYLVELLDEASSALFDYYEIERENHFLNEFINYKNLQNEFAYFKENAHEADDPDNPFPPLIL